MDTRELARIDLNLLISLQVLLEERSVSRSAERLHITQPAMSKTLSRLRELFDDPLFTRSGHRMQPTPRALQLAHQLGDILGGISQLVSGQRFDPTRADAEITIAMSEYIGVTLLPTLAERLQERAPRLNLRIVTRVENQLEQLALGNLDFALHINQAHYGPAFRVERLGGSPPAILVRENHPLCRTPGDLEALNNYPVIRLYVSDRNQAEERSLLVQIDQLSARAQGSLEISHLMTAIEVLRNTDYYMPGPSYLTQNETLSQGITALPLPTLADVIVDYVLVAHQRTENSPLHNWLWGQISDTIRELRPAHPRKLRQRVSATR
ncbi:LysR family transcriptional regulator [Mangrovimicrobium sediminis]|uniref:LysR family transcriptional regulator n=1 Tax=Mangrovimicrobium sediminis TaxID=2562682 RepID=A0A4Z0LXQ2_9GAMM|nr:LysR family transcriptional regulator [Haliea sp. SAOS-164]TGD71928.1 LysR family transcriptional regulator [Haliea sp. SAOS-164]